MTLMFPLDRQHPCDVVATVAWGNRGDEKDWRGRVEGGGPILGFLGPFAFSRTGETSHVARIRSA